MEHQGESLTGFKKAVVTAILFGLWPLFAGINMIVAHYSSVTHAKIILAALGILVAVYYALSLPNLVQAARGKRIPDVTDESSGNKTAVFRNYLLLLSTYIASSYAHFYARDFSWPFVFSVGMVLAFVALPIHYARWSAVKPFSARMLVSRPNMARKIGILLNKGGWWH